MSDLNWLEVFDDWKVGGGLRDVYVFSASEADWQRLLDVVSRHGWASSYSEDGEPVPMPAEVGRIFEHMKTRSVLWEIRPTSEIKINCFFFSPDEIDFDIDPREIVGQSQLDAVCEFVRVVGKALDKPVAVTWEGESARVQVAPEAADGDRPPTPQCVTNADSSKRRRSRTTSTSESQRVRGRPVLHRASRGALTRVCERLSSASDQRREQAHPGQRDLEHSPAC